MTRQRTQASCYPAEIYMRLLTSMRHDNGVISAIKKSATYVHIIMPYDLVNK